MQVVVPTMEAWLLYEQKAKAEGRREPITLDRVLREELPEGKMYVEEGSSTLWHRDVQLNGPGPEAYAVYNAVMSDFEEAICSR
jgi:hypothetical protein